MVLANLCFILWEGSPSEKPKAFYMFGNINVFIRLPHFGQDHLWG